MNQILDFLVKNYIYVAGISVFFIIVLIGFLVKDSRKKKNIKNKEKIVKESKDIKNAPIVAEQTIINNNDKDVPVTTEVKEVAPVLLEQTTIDNNDKIVPLTTDVKEVAPVLEPVIDLNNAQLANQRFKVVLDSNKPEILDFDENIVFDHKKLDEQVDIIDLTTLNNFQSKEEVASPKE